MTSIRKGDSTDIPALLDTGGAVLLSYQKAYRQVDAPAAVPWDVCVLDEAHLLANAGQSEHIQADAIRTELQGRPKLLVTATPMQRFREAGLPEKAVVFSESTETLDYLAGLLAENGYRNVDQIQAEESWRL